MKKNIKYLSVSIFLLAGIQAGGQCSYSWAIFNSTDRLSMTSYSAVWKQPVHTRMAGNEFHWKENSAGGRIFFYNPLPILTKELGYYSPSSKTQRSEFPNPYRVSRFASYNQNTRPKLNIWLPQKTAIPTSHQVVGALLYTALNVYGTWNQQMINNPILNPNFNFIKP